MIEEDVMGTVIAMRSREEVDMERVAELLDRLEWRLEEPCTVPGCSHDGECCGAGSGVVLQTAA